MPKPTKRAAPTPFKMAVDRPDYYKQRKVVMGALRDHAVIRFDNKHSVNKYWETLEQLRREKLITMTMVPTGEQSTELHVRLAKK